jgi:hypothetical protein
MKDKTPESSLRAAYIANQAFYQSAIELREAARLIERAKQRIEHLRAFSGPASGEKVLEISIDSTVETLKHLDSLMFYQSETTRRTGQKLADYALDIADAAGVSHDDASRFYEEAANYQF